MNAELGGCWIECRGAFRRLLTRLRTPVRFFALMVVLLGVSGIALAQTVAPQFVYVTAGPSSIAGFQIDPATGALTAVPGSPFNERLSPAAMAVNPAGTFLFVANGSGDNNVSVFAINPTTGALTEVANSPFATGLGVDPKVISTAGNGKFLYVGNTTGSPTGLSTSTGEIDSYVINQTTGELTPTPVSGPGQFGIFGPINPTGVYAHPNGKWIYFQGGSFGLTTANIIQGYLVDPPSGNLNGAIPAVNGIEFPFTLTGDSGGRFLAAAWAETCANIDLYTFSAVDGSLQGAGSWSSLGFDSGSPDCIPAPSSMAIDSSAQFLYTNIGSLDVPGLTPNQVSSPSPYGGSPWVADPIGPFVFVGGSELQVYKVNLTTGELTSAPGSPYVGGISGNLIAVTGFPPQNPAPGAQYSPGSLNFTNTVVGTPSAPQTMQFVNTGTATLNISGISLTGANSADFAQTNTCAATLAAGANCIFTVIFTPSTAAAESAAILVNDNAAGSPHSAPLTSTGVVATPPVPNLNPTSLTFAQTTVGSTASQIFTISNSGSETLTVSGIVIGGANVGDFTESNSCAGRVSGNGSCPVTVVFQPQAPGQRTATVTVSYPGSASQSIALTGSAIAATPPFTVTPTGPTSTTVQPGQAASYGASFVPAAAFSGTVTFSCSVAPAGPSCTVTPAMAQVVASNNPVATPVSVTATAPAIAGVAPIARFDRDARDFASRSSGMNALILPSLLALMLCACFAASTTYLSRAFSGQLRLRFAGSALMLAMLIAMTACGGGSGSTTPPQPKTYTVTVTAAAGTSTQTLNFTLNVQ
jgi:Lactonase, 7-bladed beta-propeller